MAIFAIGDLHLSLGTDKPMDVFPGWEGYLPKLEANWRRLISPEDTVLLAGDTSWAMNLNGTRADFAYIQSLPGQKWLMKGNHDYWWTTTRKMETFLAANGLDSLHILHNNTCIVGDTALCGTRGWPFDDAAAQGEKLTAREAGRLRMSLQAAGETRRRIGLLPLQNRINPLFCVKIAEKSGFFSPQGWYSACRYGIITCIFMYINFWRNL